MIRIQTTNLEIGDRIIKLDDGGHIKEVTTLKTEVPTLGCLGRHFITVANSLVCYGPGVVTILERKKLL